MTHSDYSPEALASLSALRGSEPTPPFDATDAMWLSAFDRGRESAAAGANVVGREALRTAILAQFSGFDRNIHGGFERHFTVDELIAHVLDALLSPSGPLRDEAVVKAEAWDECVTAIGDMSMPAYALPNWRKNALARNPYRAAALLATTTTDKETR